MRVFVYAVAAVVAAAGSAQAQNLDWGFISTAGDPDPVSVFDLANPGGTVQGIGFVDGNFNRAMDFDSENSFYYFVSTDVLNDPGDRGLWRWNNGVNTQLTTIAFSDSGDGDGTLARGNGTFYVTVDDGDNIDGDSLYAFGNLNGVPTFTEIGETGLSQLIGLAANPITGQLVGYDSSTEALYDINAATGTATLIGFSGESIGAIGGMDWSADGSTLLLSQGDDLYLVNPTDGTLTAAGNIGANSSALSYRIPAPGALALLGLGALGAGRRRR